MAACCLCIAVWNSPAMGSHEWDARMASCTGYDTAQIIECVRAELGLLRDKQIACRSVASGLRGNIKPIHATILFLDLPPT